MACGFLLMAFSYFWLKKLKATYASAPNATNTGRYDNTVVVMPEVLGDTLFTVVMVMGRATPTRAMMPRTMLRTLFMMPFLPIP